MTNNLVAHKRRPRVAEVIDSVGAQVARLLPYSPDLNSIEQMFANPKKSLIKPDENVLDDLWGLACTLFDQVSAQECATYFAHAGLRGDEMGKRSKFAGGAPV